MAPRAKDYFKGLPFDLPAAIVVFLVALPLCLGVALASNAPLFSGIIAGITGGIVVGLFSRSHLSVSGPAAGLTAIIASALATLSSYEAFLVAVVYCGILQIAFGYLKAGIIGDYVPGSVIKGMLAAIGLILILKQLPHLAGYDKDFEGDEAFIQANAENTFTGIFRSLNYITPAAFFIGITCTLFYFGWEKFNSSRKGLTRMIPAPLLVVMIGVVSHELIKAYYPSFVISNEHMVALPVAGSASEFFSFFASPDWSQFLNKEVVLTALTLALVASLESLLSIEAIDDLDPYQRVTPTNRELKAQGIGNIVSGLLGGLPVTSVIVRSSANVSAGAKTKMSTIYHGLLLLLCVAFIPALLNYIPKAALAAILIFTGYKLAKLSLFKTFYKKGWEQFLPFVITIVAILFTDLLKGVIIGIAVGLIFVIRSNFRSAMVMVNDENKFLFRLRKDVSFLNKPFVKASLEKIPPNSQVLIDATRADLIDHDVLETIRDFMLHAPLKHILVEWKGKQPIILEEMEIFKSNLKKG